MKSQRECKTRVLRDCVVKIYNIHTTGSSSNYQPRGVSEVRKVSSGVLGAKASVKSQATNSHANLPNFRYLSHTTYMPLKSQPLTKTQRELIPEGNHPARIYEIIEIGTVEGSWMGQPKLNYNVRIGFEFPTEKRVFTEGKGEQPFVLSREMSLSLGEKANLRKIVEAVEGHKLTESEAVDYDILNLAGKPLLVTVSHTEPNETGIQYANATTFSPIIKGLVVDELTNPKKVLTYESWSQEVFDSLPQFLKDKISGTKEYKTFKGSDDGSVDVDHIPF